MSSLTQDGDQVNLKYNAGFLVSTDFEMTAVAYSIGSPYRAIVKVESFATGIPESMVVPVPSSAVARKMSDMFKVLAEEMDKKEFEVD
jgi:hypothetical protein